MTFHTATPPRPDQTDIANKPLILATDLDGTFLGGSEAERKSFYEWIESQRNQVGLIFVTGRDPGFISDLTKKRGVPRPDYVVADVGTTVAKMGEDHLLSPMVNLEAPIEAAWGDASSRVFPMLHHARGLKLQSSGFRYRMSYDLDPADFDDSVIEKLEEMGLDVLISDNRFFDVLPKGVSKGPTLTRLVDHLGLDHARVLTAGDTLNDLSMLTAGVRAVAVGKSEPALIEQLGGHDSAYLARQEGVAGIAEAILHYGFLNK